MQPTMGYTSMQKTLDAVALAFSVKFAENIFTRISQ